eukprot:1152913-Pelagomonas_calceolata.AAC.4
MRLEQLGPGVNTPTVSCSQACPESRKDIKFKPRSAFACSCRFALCRAARRHALNHARTINSNFALHLSAAVGMHSVVLLAGVLWISQGQ